MLRFFHEFYKEKFSVFWIDLSKYALLTVGITLLIFSNKSVQKWWTRNIKLMRFVMTLPGPPALPLIGNAHIFAFTSTEEALRKIIDIIKYTGKTPMRFWLGHKSLVFINEPGDIEVILNSPKANKKGWIYKLLSPLLEDGLILTSGQTHKTQRKTIQPMINAKTLTLFVNYYDKHSKYCADLLDEKVNSGEFDILPYIYRCTMDVIFETILGVEARAQKGQAEELVHSFDRLYELFYLRMIKPWLHSNFIFSLTSPGKEYNRVVRHIASFFEDTVIKEKREMRKSGQPDAESQAIIIEQILESLEKTNIFSEKEFRDNLITLYLAAQDTTATAVSFTLLHLAMYPEIQDKVRLEMNEIFVTDEINASRLQGMKYLTMVLNEIMRLYPIATVFLREITEDLELESCTLPEGCNVIISPFILHRSSKFWIDPEKFIPERFYSENSQNIHPYSYIPFSAGSRSCIGKQFAYLLLKTLIINILRKFQLSTTMRIEDLELKTDISVRAAKGYHLSLTRI